MKLVIYDTKKYDRYFFEKWNKEYNVNLEFVEGKINESNVMLSKYADAVCVFVNDEVNERLIDLLSKNGVKLLLLRSAGYNNVDLKAAKGKLRVLRVPEYSPYAVAEHGIALLLALNRKIHKAYNRTRDGNFTLSGLLGFDMHGKTAGVIGTGKIALIFIKILRGFGVNVIAYDKFPNESAAKELEFTYVELDELYAKSDIISLHVPLLPDTEYIINYKSIQKMKDGVIILNTGRGKLIDTSILIEALKDGKVGGAGLDVYEEEEDYFFEDTSSHVLEDDVLARLLSFNNVIVTSHQAFFTEEALDQIVKTTFENLVDFRKGNEFKNEVVWDEENNKPKEIR